MKKICTCICHTMPGIIHAWPCCYKRIISEPPMPNKQTKQTFEAFLRVNRELAKKIQQPIDAGMECPLCDKGVATLQDRPIEHVIDNYVWKGTQYFFQCQDCKEEFTTNEVDTLSLASFQLIDSNTNA